MKLHCSVFKGECRKIFWGALTILVVLSTAGCGHIATYTDPALKSGKTGILYYPPKPYLLVARTGSKDKPNDVQVVYLPDLSQPRYAVMKAGYGSSKLSLSFSNGMLVSAGQETDPKITEAITALAGIPGALATAAKTRAETDAIRKEASDLPKTAKSLRTIANDIDGIAAEPLAHSALTSSQLVSLKRLPQQLRDAATVLDRPDTTDTDPVVKTLEGVKKQVEEIKPGAESISDTEKSFWAKLRSAERALADLIDELKPEAAPAPTLTLYEVMMDGSGTTLREVPLNTMQR